MLVALMLVALMIGVQRAISLFTSAASGCWPRFALPGMSLPSSMRPLRVFSSSSALSKFVAVTLMQDRRADRSTKPSCDARPDHTLGHERRIRANAPAAGRPQTADPAGGQGGFRLGLCAEVAASSEALELE